MGKQPVANKALWADGGGDPQMRGFYEQAKVAVATPSSPRMQQMWAPYNGALLNVIAGDDTKPAEALKAAQADAVRAVERAKAEK